MDTSREKTKWWFIISGMMALLALAGVLSWYLGGDINMTNKNLPRYERVGVIESANAASQSFIVAAHNPHSGDIQRIHIQYDEKTLAFSVSPIRDETGVLYYEEAMPKPISTVRVGDVVTVYFVQKGNRFVAERIEYGRD